MTKGLTDKTTISVETKGGMKYLDLTVEDGVVTWVQGGHGCSPLYRRTPSCVVGMGDHYGRMVGGKEWVMTCVSMGNPHAVVGCDNVWMGWRSKSTPV